MYVRGYLQGNENGRVVTIDLVIFSMSLCKNCKIVILCQCLVCYTNETGENALIYAQTGGRSVKSSWNSAFEVDGISKWPPRAFST